MPDGTDQTTRRGLILAAATGLVASAAQAAPPVTDLMTVRKEADVACVYHCDFGDNARFGQTLTNIANHFAAYGADPFAIQIAAVAHAAGIKYFLDNLEGTRWQDDKEALTFAGRIDALSKNGLKVYLCETTFKVNNIDKEKARTSPFISFVPSGVAAVGALQNKGYAYMKIG